MANRKGVRLQDELAREIDQLLEEKCESRCLDDSYDRQTVALVISEWIREKEKASRKPLGPWVSPPSGFWRTKSGELIPIVEMSDDHLYNCLKLVQKKAVDAAAEHAVSAAMDFCSADDEQLEDVAGMLPQWREFAERWPWWQEMLAEARRRDLDVETSLDNEEYVRHLQIANEARLLAEKEAKNRGRADVVWYYWHKNPEQRKFRGGQLCYDCYNSLFSRKDPYRENTPMAREDYEPVPPHVNTPFPSCECEVPDKLGE